MTCCSIKRMLFMLGLVGLLCHVSLADAPAEWGNVGDFQYNMPVKACVHLDGAALNVAESKIAAFWGEELRGVANFSRIEKTDDVTGEVTVWEYFNLLVGAEDMDENGYTFKYYNPETDKVYDLLVPAGHDPLAFKAAGYGEFVVDEENNKEVLAPFVLTLPAYAVDVVNGTAEPSRACVGDTVKITADDIEHKIFKQWTSDLEFDDASATVTSFTMPAKAVTVTAEYDDVPKYDYTVVNGTPATGQAYAGETITVTADNRAAEHKIFAEWTSLDVEIQNATQATASFVMLEKAVTVTATYTDALRVKYTVVNGTAAGGEDYAGTEIAVTAKAPAENRVFKEWRSDDVTFTEPQSVTTTFILPQTDGDVTVTAVFFEKSDVFLKPGWNLVAAPGNLSVDDNELLFSELKPFVLDRGAMAYVQASLPLAAGVPMWIFSETSQYVTFVHEEAYCAVGGMTGEEGWQLVGVGGKEDVELHQVLTAWQWKNGKWQPAESNTRNGAAVLKAGRGYFIMRLGMLENPPESWLIRYLHTNDPSLVDSDFDSDGLTTMEEYKLGTDPGNADTDGDGLPDGWELQNKKNPLDATDADTEMTTERYLVVDLSRGPNAASYPVRYSSTGPDLDNDACRTTELWLRRIPKGTFVMGSSESEKGRTVGDMAQHEVTLTQDYYIGVFECTQKQWELVMGDRPAAFFNVDYYATRPAEQVSYNDIRGIGETAGAGWPVYGHTVDAESFLGKLQEKTGMSFDLPTEAQWEHACRGGTTSSLNSGNNLKTNTSDASMDEVGRYWYNGGEDFLWDGTPDNGTAKVGSYRPNAFGLYDMHGNVYEWCLDWWGASTTSTDAETDPVGPNRGSNRMLRGGGWHFYAQNCRSANRYCKEPEWGESHYGFRIACP